MRNNVIVLSRLTALCLLAACSATKDTPVSPESVATSSLSRPTVNETVEHVLFFVRGSASPTAPMLTLTSPPGTMLFEIRGHQPVIAPDGRHQVTLGEWITPTGEATNKCTRRGTRTVLEFDKLIPNATYTVWQFVFKAPAVAGGQMTLVGVGALGLNDGSGNSFRTSDDGEGEISAVTPAGGLSIFGSIGACASDEFEVHYVAAYHIDGMTHGPYPGPDGTVAEQAAFIFRGH